MARNYLAASLDDIVDTGRFHLGPTHLRGGVVLLGQDRHSQTHRSIYGYFIRNSSISVPRLPILKPQDDLYITLSLQVPIGRISGHVSHLRVGMKCAVNNGVWIGFRSF